MRSLMGLGLSLVLALSATTGFSKEISEADLRALQRKMKASETLSVDLNQTSFKAFRGTKSVRKGKAIFAPPSSFKWMLETPVQEYKFYDGQYFYDYDPQSKSAVRYRPDAAHAAQIKNIVDMVLDFDALLKRYELSKAEEVGDQIQINLKPKAKSDIKGIELKVAPADGFVSLIKMDLTNGNWIAIDFKNPVRKPVPKGTFDLPKGVKVRDLN